MRRARDARAGPSQGAATFRIHDGKAIPDPSGLMGTRRRALGLVLVVGLIGLVGLLWLQAVLAGLSLAAPGDVGCTPVDRDRLLGVLAGAIALPAIFAGLWLVRIARRVAMASQWPYPGARLLRPVRVRYGGQARAFALVTALLGSILILGGPAIGVSLHQVVDAVLGETLILCRNPH